MLECRRHFVGPNTRLSISCRLVAEALLACLIVLATPIPMQARHTTESSRPTHRPQTETRSVSDIPLFLSRLSSRSYEHRRQSTARLMAYGPEAYPHLVRAFRGSDSPEVRLRIERIAQHIFLRELAGEGEGFLGIEPHAVTADHDARLGPGETGIVVTRVIEDTSAERAGLKAEDVIVRFNGRRITVDVSGDGFPQMVRQVRPDSVVPIEILRGDERLILRARLSTRPVGLTHSVEQQEARSRCVRWFRDRFERPSELKEITKTVSAGDVRD